MSLTRCRVVKELVFEYLRSSLVVCYMKIKVRGCICMLYVILVNTCSVDQLIFSVQCELNKLQINLVKISYLKKTVKTDLFHGEPTIYRGFYLFEFKLV
jgi:hypothetical protein